MKCEQQNMQSVPLFIIWIQELHAGPNFNIFIKSYGTLKLRVHYHFHIFPLINYEIIRFFENYSHGYVDLSAYQKLYLGRFTPYAIVVNFLLLLHLELHNSLCETRTQWTMKYFGNMSYFKWILQNEKFIAFEILPSY